MDLLTINKVIDINLKKKFGKEVGKELYETYSLFTNLVFADYHLRICKKLSMCDTPVIEIACFKNNNLPKLYYWLSTNGDCYLKDCTNTVIGNNETVEEIIFDKFK